MFNVAWPELFVVGLVALIVIGPRDLPQAMRALGRLAGKVARFGREIRNSLDQLDLEADAAKRVRERDEPHDRH